MSGGFGRVAGFPSWPEHHLLDSDAVTGLRVLGRTYEAVYECFSTLA